MRVIKAPPLDLAELLIKLGSRRLVLVEGNDDLIAFNKWFVKHEADLYFYSPGGGNVGIRRFLQRELEESVTKRVYGIVDRDFSTDAEVENCLTDATSHLFILRRYCLENYLLEPASVREELSVLYSGTDLVVPDVDTIQSDLLKMCRELAVVMAANWILLEGAAKFLHAEFDISRRETIIQQVATRLSKPLAEAEEQITAKQALLTLQLTSVENAHRYINGKFLLRKVYSNYIGIMKEGLHEDFLFNHLVWAAEAQGVHADIRTIIEDRILK